MSQVIGIDPTVDYAFKLLLGSPDHVRVTIHFLNAILCDGPRITAVAFQNPFLGKEFADDKLSVLDILATDERERRLNIEMQTSLPAGLQQRLAYYDASLYVGQLAESAAYRDLRPAIVICVLSVPLFPGPTPLHLDFRLRDKSGLVLTDDLQVHTLELTKLAVTRENLGSATAAECWAYFLRNASWLTMEEVRELFPEPEYVEAAGVLDMIRQSPGQMAEYITQMKARLDDAARIEYAREEGERKGRMEGREEGREEGRVEGRVEGRIEGERKGELLGRIATLQELLSLTSPTREELSQYDLPQLTTLWDQLQQHLRQRSPSSS